jgi:serine/threonine protein kinase
MIMEYVDGESLGQRLEREGRLTEQEALRIICQVAQGLQKAHKQGLVHRDVKPDNILLAQDGQAKLADLGLVKEIDAELNLTRTGRGLGTPHFMAPEQFRRAKYADARCDVYSLAATLYMTVTGELPFKSCGPLDAWMRKINNQLSPARELVPELSERVDWAIRRAMSADPNQRPSSCREFVEDLTGRNTRRLHPLPDAEEASDVWHLSYTDEEGVVHNVRSNLDGIRRSLREGLLGDASNVRASRTRGGPFESLRQHPEFRDLVVEAGTRTLATQVSTRTPSPVTPLETQPLLKEGTANDAPALPAAETVDPIIPDEPPLIDLGDLGNRRDWLLWLGVGIVATTAAFIGYKLLPVIMHWRLF